MANPNENAKALNAKLDQVTSDLRAAKASGLPQNVDVSNMLQSIADLKTQIAQQA